MTLLDTKGEPWNPIMKAFAFQKNDRIRQHSNLEPIFLFYFSFMLLKKRMLLMKYLRILD